MQILTFLLRGKNFGKLIDKIRLRKINPVKLGMCFALSTNESILEYICQPDEELEVQPLLKAKFAECKTQ